MLKQSTNSDYRNLIDTIYFTFDSYLFSLKCKKACITQFKAIQIGVIEIHWRYNIEN